MLAISQPIKLILIKIQKAIGRKISLGGNTGSTDEKSLSTGDVKFNIKGQMVLLLKLMETM